MDESKATTSLTIGLAAVRNVPSVEERLATLDRVLAEAAGENVAIVGFPETYIPGLRGLDFPVPPPDQDRQEDALESISRSAKRHQVAVVVGMEWACEQGHHNAAFVISRDGAVQGMQTKNQIPPSEEPFYVPGDTRRLFEIDGVPFGVTICHEGWRFPESVRWAAANGAKFVLHPQLTGSDQTGPVLERWGDPDAPYYEKAMIMRGIESTVYFASINYAMRYQESATSLIGPDGELVAFVPYGREQLLVCDLDLDRATGFYGRRFAAERYPR